MEVKKYLNPSNILMNLIRDIYKFRELINILDYHIIIICAYNPGLHKTDTYKSTYNVRIAIPENIKIKYEIK
jgi:hypothetical protein